MKVLIASGGTGGHFYPGFALGRDLRERGREVLFLVRQDDPSLVPLEKAGFPSAEADLKGLPRGLGALDPRYAWRLWKGFGTVGRVVRSWRPDVVVGMGAYLSLAAVWEAWREGVPVLIHESNAKLGLAHRLSLPFASRIALGLPIRGFADRRAVLTGTPIRPAFFDLPAPADARRSLGLDPAKPMVLVFGGSQGAQSLNTLAAKAAGLLAGRKGGGFQLLHLAGTRDASRVEGLYRGGKAGAKVLPYLENVHEALAACDLVVCRSGASTLAELVATRTPAVLVPYPHATAGHQSDNARVLSDAGAAVLAEESGLDARLLSDILEDLIYSRPERRTAMRRAFGKLPLPDPRAAADRLAALAEGLAATEERCSKPS